MNGKLNKPLSRLVSKLCDNYVEVEIMPIKQFKFAFTTTYWEARDLYQAKTKLFKLTQIFNLEFFSEVKQIDSYE